MIAAVAEARSSVVSNLFTVVLPGKGLILNRGRHRAHEGRCIGKPTATPRSLTGL
jgi:hypothetical protein